MWVCVCVCCLPGCDSLCLGDFCGQGVSSYRDAVQVAYCNSDNPEPVAYFCS